MFILLFILLIDLLISVRPVPPASVEIKDYKPAARIQTREKEEIVLQCLVRSAKPAAEIVWFKRNLEIKFGNNPNDSIISIN